MSFHEPCFLFVISWILRLKKICFVFLTVLQKAFQSSRLFDILYFSRSLLYLSSYQLLECFVILTIFECFSQAFSISCAKLLIILSKLVESDMLDVLRLLKTEETSLIKEDSSSLPLLIEYLVELTYSLTIGIVTVREV